MDSLLTCRPQDQPERLKATGLAYRQWALVYPQRYLLIFGTPLPGYHAPLEITQPVAARSLRPLIMSWTLPGKMAVLKQEKVTCSCLQDCAGSSEEWASQQPVEDVVRLVPRSGHLEPRSWAGDDRDQQPVPAPVEETAEIFQS